MVEYLKDFWYTKAGFERVMRFTIFGVGELFASGIIPTGNSGAGYYIGRVIQSMALLVKAGDKNVPTGGN